MIEFADIHKTYHMGDSEFQAVRGINLSIDKNELVALVGASGSGKTTTMQMLGLLSSPSSGSYRLLEHDTHLLSSDEQANLRNRYIGFIFQSYCLLPRLNAIENVMLPLHYRQMKNKDAQARALECLDWVEMGDYAKHRPTELSGGQQQRVAIARALVNDPALILADEPTGALDSKTGDLVMQRLKDLQREQHKTVLIVTHDPNIAAKCERIITMQDGLIQHETRGHNEA